MIGVPICSVRRMNPVRWSGLHRSISRSPSPRPTCTWSGMPAPGGGDPLGPARPGREPTAELGPERVGEVACSDTHTSHVVRHLLEPDDLLTGRAAGGGDLPHGQDAL